MEHVEEYIQGRLNKRDPLTVSHERNTLIRFFDWVVNVAGEKMKFGNFLKPLEPLKEEVNVISG